MFPSCYPRATTTRMVRFSKRSTSTDRFFRARCIGKVSAVPSCHDAHSLKIKFSGNSGLRLQCSHSLNPLSGSISHPYEEELRHSRPSSSPGGLAGSRMRELPHAGRVSIWLWIRGGITASPCHVPIFPWISEHPTPCNGCHEVQSAKWGGRSSRRVVRLGKNPRPEVCGRLLLRGVQEGRKLFGISR